MLSDTAGPATSAAEATTVASAYALPSSAVATATAAVSGAWSFEDTEVAARFDREALCHIPDYVRVIEASVDAVEKALAALLQARDEAPAQGSNDINDGSSRNSNGSISQTTGALWKLDPAAVTPEQAAAADVHYTPAHALRVSRARQIFRVVDVGCATGTTLVALLARGFTDVHGVEASRPMLAGARRKLVEGLPPHHVVPHHDNHTELAATAATMTAESGADASSSASSTSSSSSAYGSWRAFQPVSAEYAERHLHLAQAPNFELPVHTLLAPLPQSSHAESDVKEDDETERQDSHLAVQDQTSEGAEPQVLLGAVVLNWTLHFIPDEGKRFAYLKDVYSALLPGGILVLTEKTAQDAAMRDMYHSWKRSPPRCVSPAEVEAKARRLVGVLVAFTPNWYETALNRAGFVNASVLWSRFGFVTWVAYKPAQ